MSAAVGPSGLEGPGRRPLPVTGAWQPGDPPGGRRFLAVSPTRSFALEGGGALREVTLAYETWGSLNQDASNAVLVCHALTGDSHVVGDAGPGHAAPGWWSDLVGPGRALDTDRLFVVCANVLGGCQGSTGPASLDPATGRPYGSAFPVVTVRDMVRAQRYLADHLGVERWLTVVGGSMGGMQVLEWGVLYPHRVRSLVSIASDAAASALQIAWSAVGRGAIANDPNWRGGDYYGAPAGQGPHAGLALARQVAQIHYRSDAVFAERFGRELVQPLGDRYDPWAKFQVESYLDYHGEKLVRRFDANSYLVLNRAMDLHDLVRGRGSLARALSRIEAPVCTMSITSDTLYPPYQQLEVRDLLAAQGTPTAHVLIDSPHGHDGFLIEFEQVGAGLAKFLASV
ncbi:MAG: homoserine O-acetyltransferase [Acidimicrobiia bacterium]|nr:homoserine O-acetyltransferase [Acidimicrobiia bacterium]